MPKVSVIVPTYNRLNRLQKVLAGLEAQSYPYEDFEVVVVSDGSTDGTDEFLNSYRSGMLVKPVTQKNQGPAMARNNGLEEASGEYILFIDDDIVPDKNLIFEHMRFHQLYENAVVIGPMLTPDDFDMFPWVYWEQSMLMKQYDALAKGSLKSSARQFYTGNASLMRATLIEAGGFDTTFQRAEDVELAYRLADLDLNFVFNPEAIGFHYAERSFDSWLKIPYVYGCNDVKFTLEKNQDWLLPTIAREYKGRNFFTKVITTLCLDHKSTTNLTIWMLVRLASLGHFWGLQSVPRMAYSGIFNLRYYQGVADELGGREKFFNYG